MHILAYRQWPVMITLPNLFRHHVFQHFGLVPVAQGGTIQAQ